MAALSILVTGSSGFIGTHVVRHLHESGHMVTALDCAAPKEELPPGVRFHMCDIREGLLPRQTFDAVVHLAALAGVRQSIDRKLDYEFTNVIGTIRLLEHCRRMGIPHFVFASSSSVYGTDAPLPFSEDGVRSSWPSTGREKVPPRSTSVRAKITPSWTWPRQRLLYTFRGPALQILHLQLPTKTPTRPTSLKPAHP
jgi:nucleoside-diphosphate-sugar epimerase